MSADIQTFDLTEAFDSVHRFISCVFRFFTSKLDLQIYLFVTKKNTNKNQNDSVKIQPNNAQRSKVCHKEAHQVRYYLYLYLLRVYFYLRVSRYVRTGFTRVFLFVVGRMFLIGALRIKPKLTDFTLYATRTL